MLARVLYSPLLAQLVVTRRCNLACGYCNEFDTVSRPVPTELVAERIAHVAALGAFSLELTGGEPLLHPELDTLIRSARSEGFFRVMLISNGFLLGRERIERLNEAGLQHLQISVDGVRPNATTIKVLKTLRSKLEALSEHARFRVTVSAVVGAAPPHEVADVIATARSLGHVARVLILHEAGGGARVTPELARSFPQLARALGAAWREGGAWRGRVAQPGGAPFKCRAGARYVYIDEHGIVRWCSQTMGQFGKSLRDYRPADLQRQFHTAKPCATTCTVGCARTNSALDEWRPQRSA